MIIGLQPLDLAEIYAYGTSKKLLCKNKKIKSRNIRKQYKKRLT